MIYEPKKGEKHGEMKNTKKDRPKTLRINTCK